MTETTIIVTTVTRSETVRESLAHPGLALLAGWLAPANQNSRA